MLGALFVRGTDDFAILKIQSLVNFRLFQRWYGCSRSLGHWLHKTAIEIIKNSVFFRLGELILRGRRHLRSMGVEQRDEDQKQTQNSHRDMK